jgi:outer membrane lipoprotein-sorting protein
MRPTVILAAVLVLASPLAATAAERQIAATAPDPQQTADLGRIETYLNGLTTAQAPFTLVAPDGQQSRGQFYLSRPAKLRFDYAEPKGNALIADGDYVIYWDAQQKEASNLPISQTPLAFLLKPHVSLSDSAVRITRFEHTAGVIRVSIVQAKDPSAGSVTVAFSDQPLELRGWTLVDAQGQTTAVTFSDWKLGASLDQALFHFQAPDSGKRHR